LQQDNEELLNRGKQNIKEKKSNKGIIRNPKSKKNTQEIL